LISVNVVNSVLNNVVKILRQRHVEVHVDRVVFRKSKVEIYMNIRGRRAKVILKPSGEGVTVRAFTGLTGLDISIRRIFTREYLKALRLKSRGEESV